MTGAVMEAKFGLDASFGDAYFAGEKPGEAPESASVWLGVR